MIAAHSFDTLGLDPICFLLREGKGDTRVFSSLEGLSAQGPNSPKTDANKCGAKKNKKCKIHKADLTSISKPVQPNSATYGCCGAMAAFDETIGLGHMKTKDPTC